MNSRMNLSLLASAVFFLSSLPVLATPPPLLAGMCASIRDGGRGAFEVMQQMGVRSIRADAPWAQIELTRGQYTIPSWIESTVDSAVAAHMEPLLVLDYGNPLYVDDKPRSPSEREAFARYASFVVAHFKGKVRYFELFNEWETHTGRTTPGNAQDYIELAKVVYPTVKAANPDAILIASGIADLRLSDVDTGFIAAFLKAGGMRYVDGLSLHPYNQPGDDGTPEASMEIVDAIYHLTKRIDPTGSQVPIYITEMGYSSYGGRLGVSEEDEANYLARYLVLAASRNYIRGLWWYGLKDVGADPANREHHFGVLRMDLRPKPAGLEYAAVTQLLLESESITTTLQSGVYSSTIKGPSGTQIVTWARNHEDVAISSADSPQHRRRLIELSKLSSR